MKRLFLFATLASTLALFAACEDDYHRQPRRPGGFRPVNPPPEERPRPDPDDDGEKPEKPEKKEKPAPEEPKVNPVPEQPKQVGEVPYGKNVPGKPGFVTSPFSPYSGYIDVRGFPPGTEVKDPYSGKTFLVP